MSQYIGTTTAYMAGMVGGLYLQIADEIKDDRHTGRYYWDYQQRSAQCTNEQTNFFSLWPCSRYGNMDPDLSGLEGNCMVGLDWSTGHTGNDYSFEYTALGNSGTLRPYYIGGQVIDNNGNPVAGATIDCYVVNGAGPGQDLMVWSTVSHSDGTYEVATQFYTSYHYLVASLGGATPVAGTTVQTILPSQ